MAWPRQVINARPRHRKDLVLNRRRFLPSLLPILILSWIGIVRVGDAQQPRRENRAFRDGELLVKFRPETSGAERQRKLAPWRPRQRARLRTLDIEHVKLPPDISIEAAVSALASDPAVVAVQPNYQRRAVAAAPPNDPFWLDDSLWGLQKIKMPPTWTNYGAGTGNVVIADIDSGVNYAHPDLAANMWRNPGEVPGNGIDDDGNGFVDDIHGIDTANDDSDPMDDNGHGTHTAGTFAGVGNNGIGVAGINWNAKILACKFLNKDGLGYDSDAIECFDYLVNLRRRGINIRVTNNSWGSTREGFPTAMKNAIDAVGAEGILNVFAAGNDGRNNDLTPVDPASLPSPSIVSVAASNQSDNRPAFSNYGVTSVDLAAPGVSIRSAWGDSYASTSGTSMAAPHVAGVAALMSEVRPDLPIDVLKTLLLDNVERTGPWGSLVASGGRLDAHLTLMATYEAIAPQTMLGSTVPGWTNANTGMPWELGTRFFSTVAGKVTALRFWKSPQENGPHVGRLWTADGTLLATVSFSNETASGWQQQPLPAPISLDANRLYVVSVTTGPNGYFGLTLDGLAGGLTSGALRVAAGANGVYGSPGGWPTSQNTHNYFRDVAFVPGTSTGGAGGTAPTAQTLLTTQVPGYPNANTGTAWELGTRFFSAVGGQITALRFWKAVNENGPHVGRLWTAEGALLATIAFAGETASGWQQQALAAPVTLEANRTYVVSVTTGPNGYFGLTIDGWASGLTSGALSVLAGASGLYGPPGSLPTAAITHNYFRDVVFVPSGGAPSTLLASQAPGYTNANTGTPWELGTRFSSTVAGQVTGLRFWKSPLENGPHVGRLWTAEGALLASVTFAGETASGWQQQSLSTPVALDANRVYVVSVSSGPNGYFGLTLDGWASGLVSGPLRVTAGSSGLYGSPGSWPTSPITHNYFRDVVFVPE